MYGHSDIMDLNLENYNGEIINKENLSIQKYIVELIIDSVKLVST